MKINDILLKEEDTNNIDEIESEIIDFIFYIKNQGITEIDTESTLSKLQDIGIDVDEKLLIDVLNKMPDLVDTATYSNITLKSDKSSLGGNVDKQKSKDAVAKAAKSANPLT